MKRRAFYPEPDRFFDWEWKLIECVWYVGLTSIAVLAILIALYLTGALTL